MQVAPSCYRQALHFDGLVAIFSLTMLAELCILQPPDMENDWHCPVRSTLLKLRSIYEDNKATLRQAGRFDMVAK